VNACEADVPQTNRDFRPPVWSPTHFAGRRGQKGHTNRQIPDWSPHSSVGRIRRNSIRPLARCR